MDSVLPKLILQPLVENSIYHGIREKEGEGMIGITGRKAENGDVLLCVEDNGVGILPEQLKNLQEKLVSGEKVHQEGYGIFNVNQRIQLNYGVPYGLSILFQGLMELLEQFLCQISQQAEKHREREQSLSRRIDPIIEERMDTGT